VSGREPWTAEEAEQIVRRHEGRKGALLPILNDIQAAFGHVPDGVVPIVAEALNLSRAEVHGVVTFYHDLKRAPHDRPVVKLCRAEACQARGVERIAPLFEQDARIHVETVYCLGLCASGPSAMVGDRVYARLDNDAAARRLIDSAAGGSPA
jgi:formate dehydrogenase subunit gamma